MYLSLFLVSFFSPTCFIFLNWFHMFLSITGSQSLNAQPCSILLVWYSAGIPIVCAEPGQLRFSILCLRFSVLCLLFQKLIFMTYSSKIYKISCFVLFSTNVDFFFSMFMMTSEEKLHWGEAACVVHLKSSSRHAEAGEWVWSQLVLQNTL